MRVLQSQQPTKQDEIAARQRFLLKQRLQRGAKLRLHHVKQPFLQMKDHS
jgi:hypothetical protein